jgi:hypothetical protein
LNILLVEPDYNAKFPPLGLMKISAYHKGRGDKVRFVKGIREHLDTGYERVYISTLFTYQFDLTVKTIRYYKRFAEKIYSIFVGGILATLLPEKLQEETGIKNVIIGLLDNSKKIGFRDKINIDSLTPDYSILDSSSSYPDAYFLRAPRGCPNSCSFCAVPRLEPKFYECSILANEIEEIDRQFGKKRNLILMDNNILYSKNLPEIIKSIQDAGFTNTRNYISPSPIETFLREIDNTEDLSVKQRREIEKYIRRGIEVVTTSKDRDYLSSLLSRFSESSSPNNIIKQSGGRIERILSNYVPVHPVQRYVDFNQGLDVALLNEETMRLLSSLPIRPLRIAFDSIKDKKSYIEAVRLAAKYKITKVSNYLLYNYLDKPEDLWERIDVNRKLIEELGIHIYSFPMKYSPADRTDRTYIGKHWNRKFLRAIQANLNLFSGLVPSEYGFIRKFFGETIEEYRKILYMPFDFIVYRAHFEKRGLLAEWEKIFETLSTEEKAELCRIVGGRHIIEKDADSSKRLKKILPYYQMKYDDSKGI